jgi:hypothetical protein
MADEDRPPSPDELTRRLRRFSIRLTVTFILTANVLFLSALWVSGLDLDQVFGERDLFDPVRDVCLRMAWYRPQGEQDPVRLCKEWINLKDSSGKVHKFEKDAPITKGKDGKFYVHPPNPGDGRIIALLIFVIAMIAAGMWAQRVLIARYRSRLLTGKAP